MSCLTTQPVLTTGIAGLDSILGGGLPRDRLYLVQGDPGVGKTTLALQFLLEGRRLGETGLFVTLGETADELRSVAASHGWDLDGIHIFEVATSDIEDALQDDESYDVFHPSEVELGQLMRTMLERSNTIKPTRVVIDSLSEVRLLARDGLRYRRQLLAIKHFFAGRGATVLLLDASLRTSGSDLQTNTLVHGVIHMEQTIPSYGLKRRRLSITKLRGVRFDDGFHDFKVFTGGLEIYPRLVTAPEDPETDLVLLPSGLPELDEMLGGGLPLGTSTVILGPAGVGKSTLSGYYATSTAARGEKTAIFSFDESRRNIIRRSEDLGIPMKKHLATGDIRIHQIDPGDLAPGQFANMVRESVEKDHVKMVIIDSLTGYLNATPDEHFLVVQLHELLTYLGSKGVCTLIVVAQHGLFGDGIRSAVDASYIADAVILLRFFEHEGHVRKAISALKKRTGGHDPLIRELQISPGSVRVGAPLKDFHGIFAGNPVYTGGNGPLLGEQHDVE